MSWKDPAPPNRRYIHRSLELQINLYCNWTCVSCDSFSQFPQLPFTKAGVFDLGQVRTFIGEMHAANGWIGRIRILGGERTVNPRFALIVEVLKTEVVERGHVGELEVITNGSHPEKIAPVKHLLNRVRVSGEARKNNEHVANMIHSPRSLGYEGKVCSAPYHCGWSLNHWGFFPCSAGAGLARFLDDVPRWQRTSLPLGKTLEIWPDLTDLCGDCYHSLKPEHKIKSGTSDPSRNQPNDENAKRLGEWHSGKQMDWPVYGQLTNAPLAAQ